MTKQIDEINLMDRKSPSLLPRKKVLMLAYACSPYRGSEPGAGWHRAVETAKYFDTWVLCKKQKYEEEIKRYFAENGSIPGLQFCFIPRTRFEKVLKRTLAFWYIAYNLWHRRAYRAAKVLSKKIAFDIVHQANMCGFREPGYLWKLNIPFIWGPIGGTDNYPLRFLPKAGLAGAIKEFSRALLNMLQFRFRVRVRRATWKARAVIVANSEGERAFLRVHKVKPFRILDVGIEKIFNYDKRGNDRTNRLRILWSSAFEHGKALHLLLLALAKMPPNVNYELRILGDGKRRESWRRLSQKLKIDHNCQWMGWLLHKEALLQYRWADIFVFTSLRDTCGTVILEAISHGVPVICFDHQGAGDVITEKCGIKIKVARVNDAISELSYNLMNITKNRALLAELSKGAFARAKEFLWTENGRLMKKIYENIL